MPYKSTTISIKANETASVEYKPESDFSIVVKKGKVSYNSVVFPERSMFKPTENVSVLALEDSIITTIYKE